MLGKQWVKGSLIFLLVVVAGLTIGSIGMTGSRNPEASVDDEPSLQLPEFPSGMDFAGEPVPLENFDTRESLDRELLVNTYWHSQTIQLIKRAHRFFPVIERILAENGIPDDFKYIALAESGLLNVVSPAGAVGFWQFLKGTARDYGLEVNNEVDERYHLEKSTRAACRYIREAHDQFGNWTLVAASFNIGKLGLKKQIEIQREHSYYDLLLGEETERYVFRLLAMKLILNDPGKYGFRIHSGDLYPRIDTRMVQVDSTVHDFAGFAHHFGTNYKMLKYFNPWLRKPYLTNKAGKTYTIVLPAEGARTRKYYEIKEEGTDIL